MKIDSIQNIMSECKKIFFVGIGGISMSSAAMITRSRGYYVAGSDRAVSSATDMLERNGITVIHSHNGENVIGFDVLVYTAAIKNGNPELEKARELGIPCLTRAEFLGWLMRAYEYRIGVAGTHGKSTVTSMISEIFLAAQLNPTIASGAELSDIGGAYKIGGTEYFIFEACEYTDSFLSFFLTTAVVTNIEYDHADYFKNMDQLLESFRKYISIGEKAVLNYDDKKVREIAKNYNGEIIPFGIESRDVPFRAENIIFKDGYAGFDFVAENKFCCRVDLTVPGRHNIYDALAAAATSYINGVKAENITAGLNRFKGAKRRFEYKGKTAGGAGVYDDYAHHPSEIRATLMAAKPMGKRIVCVFQPHTYSRTAGLFDEFINAFDDAAEVIFTDIYAAREDNTFGITSKLLADKVKGAKYMQSFDGIADYIRKTCGVNDIVMVLGAGDITKLCPMLVQSR